MTHPQEAEEVKAAIERLTLAAERGDRSGSFYAMHTDLDDLRLLISSWEERSKRVTALEGLLREANWYVDDYQVAQPNEETSMLLWRIEALLSPTTKAETPSEEG